MTYYIVLAILNIIFTYFIILNMVKISDTNLNKEKRDALVRNCIELVITNTCFNIVFLIINLCII